MMRESKLFIFLCGHRAIPSSLHRFFSSVRPTFISFAAFVIGMLKYFLISSIPISLNLDIRSLQF